CWARWRAARSPRCCCCCSRGWPSISRSRSPSRRPSCSARHCWRPCPGWQRRRGRRCARRGSLRRRRSVAEAVRQLEGVRKSYAVGTPGEVEVLHGIDLRLGAGEFAALIGPSGSGKSTLLNLIGLLDRPGSGRVLLAGQDTSVLDEQALTALRGRTLGFVFQFHHLIGAFTAAE